MPAGVERLEPIVECRFGLDGGAMFGVVPKPLWERASPADDRNRIRMATRCIYVEAGDRRMLIDTGMGDVWNDKERDIYAVSHPNGSLGEQLADSGVAADAITDVIITHLHFDHAGGLTVEGPGGSSRPAFPGATHWVQREHWTWAHSPSVRDAGSFRPSDFAALTGPEVRSLKLVDGPAEIAPGVEVIATRGHTPGMQLVKLAYRDATIVYGADLIPTFAHVPVPWVMGYDVHPLTTCSEKAELLANAVRHDWILAVEHDPDHGFARVEQDSRGRYRAGERSVDIDALL